MGEVREMPAPAHPKLRERLKRHARLLFPGADLDKVETWLGHRPSTPDSLPVIGPVTEYPTIILAFGPQHIGLTTGPKTGPKTGRLVAQLANGETPNEDLSAVSSAWFEKGKTK